MKNIQEQVAKTREIALYCHVSVEDFYSVMEVWYVDYDENLNPLPEGQRRERPLSDYVRISEPVKVRFESISDDEIIGKAVQSLNEEERKLLEEMNRKLAGVRERRSQLLALTHQVTP